jgi:hypothetical protein
VARPTPLFSDHARLQRWDLSYRKEEAGQEVVLPTPKPPIFFDMLFRHTIFTVEVLPTKTFIS